MQQYIPAEIFSLNDTQGNTKNSISILYKYKSNGTSKAFNCLVTELTLICIRNGKIKITTEHEQDIYCEAPGMLVLEKDQVVSASLVDVEEHHSFEILEIPQDILVSAFHI